LDRQIIQDSKSDATSIIANRVEEIANKRRISMAKVSLAWTMSKDHMIGSTSSEHLKDIIGE